MLTLILTIFGGLIGIASMILAFKLNPKQVIYSEQDNINKQLKYWEAYRDEALKKNLGDHLAIALANIKQLRERQGVLLQRLAEVNSR